MIPSLQDFKEEYYRFIIIFLYICVCATTACISYTFSSISRSVGIAYSTTEFDIYYITICYSIYFIPVNFLANYTLDHIGVKPSLIFCSFCQIICTLLRMFISSSIWYVYIGHTIGALGNPFCVNAISKISLEWFLPENRMIATAFMTGGYMLGTSLSFSMGGWIIGDDQGLTIEELQANIQYLLLCTFLLASCIGIVTLLFYREKPNVPTCFVSNYPREKFFVAIKAMAFNQEFRLLCLGFSFLMANYVVFITFLDDIIGKFGFTQIEIASIGASMNLSCVIGKITIGFIAKKYISYKNTLLLINYSILGSLLCLLFSLIINSFGAALFFSIIFGFFLQMYWAPCLELSCEMVFPIGEANANGNLVLSGCVFNMLVGFVFSGILSSSTGVSSSYFGFFYFIISYIISGFCFFSLNGKLKREEKEIEMIIAEKYNYREFS